MQLSRRGLLGSAAALSTAPLLRARGQTKPTIKLGVLTDLSGTYRDNTGPTTGRLRPSGDRGDSTRARMASTSISISADHQNKPDVAASIARQWFDQGVRRDHRRADLLGGARGRAGGEGEGQDHAERVRHRGGADRRAMQPQHHRLEFRYLRERRTRPVARWCGRASSRGSSSPPTTRSASRWKSQNADGGEEGGRRGEGRGALSVPRHHRFLVLPDAGEGERRQGAGPRQRRSGHAELHQAGARVRPQQDDEDRAAAAVHHRRACARARRSRPDW